MKKGQETKIIDATLKLALTEGWSAISLSQIAAAAKIPLAEIYDDLPSKIAVLAAYGRRIDLDMLEASKDVDPDDTARDRLFDVIMNRFDAMAEDKRSLQVIFKDLRRLPFEMLAMRQSILQSLRWMLEAAHLDAGGLRGAVRQRGLAMIYSEVFSTWLDDEDPGLSKTMALLDRRLRRVEGIIQRLQSTATDFDRMRERASAGDQPTFH